MDKATFESRLIEATQRVLAFTPEFVINELPPECRYFIYPNSSADGFKPIGKDEERFPEDLKRGRIGPVEVSQVVNFLWRNGRVPQWINIQVHSTDENYTYLKLTCCGRFVGDSRILLHKKEGLPPFHLLSPDFPPNWREELVKFDLNEYR